MTIAIPRIFSDSHRTIRWQQYHLYRISALLYVGLMIVLFPFVCWGSIARTDHQHGHAHFVFDTHHQSPLDSSDRSRAAPVEAEADPDGQATPLALLLLLLSALTATSFLSIDPSPLLSFRTIDVPDLSLSLVNVQTPPPRGYHLPR